MLKTHLLKAASITGTDISGADSVCWRDGRIVAAGSFADVRAKAAAFGSAPEVTEFPDGMITPGFIDGHTHFAEWALGRRRVNLAGCRTRAEAVTRVAAATPTDGWVLGQGYDPNGWEAPPSREALDRVLPDTPAALDSHDVHSLWVNSRALAICGIDRNTPDPEGGGGES